MIGLLVAASLIPIQVACTNCNSSGWVVLDCPMCHGRGKIDNPRRRSTPPVPCPRCVKGLSTPDKRGTGKIRRTCPVCKGLKKIRK